MQQISTRIVNNDERIPLDHRQTAVNIELGQIRETSVWVRVSSNYAARYNFAVRNYKYVDKDIEHRTMRNMRGGRFFLHHFIVLLLLGLSIYCIIKMDKNKAIVAMPITTSILYLILTCFNWHIYRTNDNVMHDCMIEVPDSYLPDKRNRFFTIPVHARIQNRDILSASDGRTTVRLTQLQQRYYNLTDIKIMIYRHDYKTACGTFPAVTILHFFLFLGILVGSIYQLSINLNLIPFIYKQILLIIQIKPTQQ